MKTISNFIISHKKTVIILALIMVLISFLFSKLVLINYDLESYLPEKMPSYLSAEKLKSEFNIAGTALLMLENMNMREIVEIEQHIENIDGVKGITYLDDIQDIYIPIEYMEKEQKEKYLSSNESLMIINFKEKNNTDLTREAIAKIKKLLEGKDYYLAGNALSSIEIQEKTGREVPVFTVIAAIIAFIIIALSMESFIESLLVMVCVFIAIILNMGTNIFIGEISSISKTAGPILQMAVSLDYAIILVHRFHEEKKLIKESKDAMASAMKKAFSAVSASAMTTVAGFAALLTMQYGIGSNLGFVLAKGIIFSILVTVTVLPCLILFFEKIGNRYKYKVIMPSLKKSGRIFLKYRNVFLVLMVILMIPATLGKSNVEYLYSSESTLPDNSESIIAANTIKDVFEHSAELYVVIPNINKNRQQTLVNEIKQIEGVKNVSGIFSFADSTIPDMYLPDELKNVFLSKDGYTYFSIVLNAEAESDEAFCIANRLDELCTKYYNEYYITGNPVVYQDLSIITGEDFNKVNIATYVFIGLILLLTFKSLSLPIILVFVIQIAININVSLQYFLDKPIMFITYIIIGAIQLGASIDYSILFTERYIENLKILKPIKAAEQTFRDSGRSILTSALTFFSATLVIGLISTITTIKELTLMISRGVVLSFGMVILVLPALLIILDPLIRHTTLNWPTKRKKTEKVIKNKINWSEEL